jgi:hypothetical protein
VPASVIVSDNFEAAAKQIVKSAGYPDIPVLVTANPVMYLTPPEIQQRIDEFFDQVVASLREPA